MFVLDMKQNRVSVSKLVESGYSVNFDNAISIYRNGDIVCSGTRNSSLYFLHPTISALHNVETENPNKRKASQINDTYLWHLKLGHKNPMRIRTLMENGLLCPLDFDQFPQCGSCLKGKMTKRSFPATGHRSQEVLELIHTDVCGPMSKPARHGYQ